jgi:branched-subunit amino acid ABC-type transport system permease component
MLELVFLFFLFTPLGLAMRAAAQNPVSSRLVGIRVGWMLAFGWGLAGAIGAVAGMMAAPIVYPDHMMSGIVLYGFSGALLGGIDNPWGAALGGFVVGIPHSPIIFLKQWLTFECANYTRVEPSRFPPRLGWPIVRSPTTLTRAVLPALSARSREGRNCSGRSTCSP